ncbi:polyketide cyclase/dehydrase/lipid transport protein [Pseudonocardia autotrophica]|uniref:Polyketide cyclase / dehydrase and lipid transport n=2 Tax=Pseudonocardia TaxID=1847 RepID=A0A1Y2MNA0_PSEAH|nr:Polyketide cyclase / dehydrase and lipid transport [Pseudonocardia autotrophica]TDN77155.1 polyketide cyclase/dehydrase/lipid transport protein [Pseudonocardia autotrophica]BBG01160.1 polyketide cyclase [Pseudonocardia autotrophica]GEC26784.1 polyketide cyclase [Pseudonocardia saturnea]
MPLAHAELLRDTIDIEAPPDRVWGLISDVRHMSRWSPQVDSVRLRDGVDQIGPGTEFTNLNHEGELRWTTHGTIVRFTPEQEIAFRIEENWTIWSFRITPLPDDRTRLIQRRGTPDGISDYSLDVTERYLGGQQAFTHILRAGMRQTLQRIKAAAEQPDAAV